MAKGGDHLLNLSSLSSPGITTGPQLPLEEMEALEDKMC